MNKTIDYYMKLPYRLEIVPDTEEGGYGARYPELPGCITCAETLVEVVANAEDAKRAWLEAALEEGLDIAEPSHDAEESDYSGQFKLRMPKSLHKSLSVHAKQEYCLYLLTMNDSVHAAKAANMARI